MKIIFGLVLSFLLAPAAFTQNSATTVFNDSQGMFSISVPGTWRIKKAPSEGNRFEASRGSDLEFEFVGISVKPLPDGIKLTPAAYADVFIKGRPEYWQTLANATYSDAKIISKGAAKISNQHAIFLIAEGTVEFEKSKFLERTYSVQTVFQGQVVGISFSAATKKFQSVLPEYEKMVASFALKPGK